MAPPSNLPAPSARVEARPWRVDVADARAFGPDSDEDCARFLRRVLRLEEVRSVHVDRVRGTATIRHRAGTRELPDFVRRLAQALRGAEPPLAPGLPRRLPRSDFVLHRHRHSVSFWEVLSDRPGSVELRHGSLAQKTPRSRRTLAELGALPGVKSWRTGLWGGRVHVEYDTSQLNVTRLLLHADELVSRPEPWGDPPSAVPTPYGLAPVTVGVAAVGILLPEVAAVSVVLLVGMNVKTFRDAYLEVRQLKAGLPSLYSAIVATTLATGQFLASALMTWFFRFWCRRYHNVLADARLEMLEECLPRPPLTRLVLASGAEALVPFDRPSPGDQVAVSAREVVPADGMVVSGEAIVDESALTGRPGATRKRSGLPLLAGTVVLQGEVRARVERTGHATRASQVGRYLVRATSPATGARAPTLDAEAFADRTVPPTLAVAGLGGLALGDLLTVGAILRPDYATGPGISGPLGALGDVADCFDRGVLIGVPDVLSRLAAIDVVVIDDRPGLRRFALSVDRVETGLSEDIFFHLMASAFRHRADERATALERACRESGSHVVLTRPLDWRGGGVTVSMGGHRVHVGHSGPALGDGGGLTLVVDAFLVGMVSFRTGGRLAAADALEMLQASEPDLRFALVSDRPADEVAGLAVGLGADSVQGGLDPIGKAAYISTWRDAGHRVAFVGDCRAESAAAAAADVAIDVGPDLGSPAAVHFLNQGLDHLDALWRVARDHAERGRIDRLGMFVPNLFCIAGAFLLGFTGLHAVVLSNLGTYGLYTRAAARLDAPRRPRSLAAALATDPGPDEGRPS
jgi:cation transport ATPase